MFSVGDGNDELRDSGGAHFLQFGPGVDPAALILNYTATSDSRFRLAYGHADSLVAKGAFSSYFIQGVTVGGVEAALVHRSDLTDGVFRDTRVDDVFEPGTGNDIIHAGGWGDDAFRFFSNDGADTIAVARAYQPDILGEIRFAADVDPAALSIEFTQADALVGYGDGDSVYLDLEYRNSLRDNAISRFTLVSEADPEWLPLIRAEGAYGNYYGSFGADHIIGGDYIDTILPGYGDDIIEAGGGDDRIILNEAYMYAAAPGTGHKQVSGGQGDDTVLVRLHQGEAFHYQRGDGHDLIQFDWSYQVRSPYRLILDVAQDTVTFVPSGQDTLVFGEGISLADLRFIRTGDSLNVLMLDGSGSIRMNEFFHAYDVDPSAWTGRVSDLYGADYFAVDSLLHPAVLTVMPKTPIAGLVFADGTNFDMVSVLGASLEISEATLLGTEGADLLQGGEGDDVIEALGGDDDIEDFGGTNRIAAGAGADRILVGSDNIIDPGHGDDFLDIASGSNTIRFGPGSGNDLALFDVAAAAVVLAIAEGVTAADIEVSLAFTEWGDVPVVSLAGSSDSFTLAGLQYDPALDARTADTEGRAVELHFADGTVVSGAELQQLARGTPGEVLTGGRRKDVLVGTGGDDTLQGGKGRDTMMAAAGDDLLIGGAGHDILSGEAGNDRYLFAPGDGRDLIRNADAALYHAKKNGGNDLSFYEPKMSEASVDRLMTKSRLKRSFERDELLVHYQPKYNLQTGEVFGAEALVRWELPDRGLILPSDFIPIAEETSLIIEIGEWVLDKVCEDFRIWQKTVSSPGRVSVNLSLKQLRQLNFIKRIRSILRGHEVSPTSLELEITETTLMENPARTIKLLDQLYGLGLHLAIDDFGTGYSSLSALQQFPISTLKIDRSFVRDIATNPDDATIVDTIIQMGRNLNMDVVAEGVEEEEQLDFLQERGCNYAQGLLFGDPMSADNYLELLLAQADGTDSFRALFA